MIRIFDILFSAIFLLILSPVLFIVVCVLSVTGEKEIFYIQDRIGKDGKSFKLFKFATMLKDSPKLGTGTITLNNDPRVLPVGKILRTTKLNELPQLINILKGDMSMVGPRPLTADRFSSYSVRQRLIIGKLQPGLSGIGSIIFRDEERYLKGLSNVQHVYDNIIAPYKGELEVWYAENRSLSLYFLLIFLTIVVVLRLPTSDWLIQRLKLPNKPQPLVDLEGK